MIRFRALRLAALAAAALSQGACSLLNASHVEAVDQLGAWHRSAVAYVKASPSACRVKYRAAREKVGATLDEIGREADDKKDGRFSRVDLDEDRLEPEPAATVAQFQDCAGKVSTAMRKAMQAKPAAADEKAKRLLLEMNEETREDAAYQLQKTLKSLRWPDVAGGSSEPKKKKKGGKRAT